jgi:hypothetical protein
MTLRRPASAAAAFVLFAWGVAATHATPSTGLEAFTKGHSRVAWVQDQSDSSSDTMARGDALRLMGYDSRDGRGECAVIGDSGSYAKPLITPDGQRIVVSNRKRNSFMVVNWDGSTARQLHTGYAVNLWRDPSDGVTWVYYLSRSRGTGERHVDGPIRRRRLDGEAHDELVWDATPITPDNFQVSRDGRHAAGLFPWPNAGLATLPNRAWRKFGTGCWTSLAPDNSLVAWVFDGQHRNIHVHSRSGYKWRVSVNAAPGINGFEVYHPRWSNHARYMVMTGPYLGEAAHSGGNRIRAGGKAVEIYVGRFHAGYQKIEAWHQLTDNASGDFYPDLWIADGGASIVPDSVCSADGNTLPGDADVAELKTWPGSHAGLIFLWENARKSNAILGDEGEIVRSCRMRLQGDAIYDRYHDLVLDRGSAVPEKVDDVLLAACRQSNQFSLEAVITPADTEQAMLQRLITFSSESGGDNFTLGQDRGDLVLRLRTSDAADGDAKSGVVLCSVRAGQPQHVIVSYAPGRLRCYLNGKVVAMPHSVTGDLSNWTAQKLKLGDEWGGGRNWQGKLEGLAIWSRATGPEEAVMRFELYRPKVTSRPKRDYAKVRVKLVEKSTRLTHADIAPYRRCLVVNVYDVEEVLSGSCDEKRIAIAQWSMLDTRMLPDSDKIGETYEFLIEAADEETHPELVSERMAVDVDSLLLDLYIALRREL